MENLKKFLSEQYVRLAQSSKKEEKVQILVLIIDIKRANSFLRNSKNTLYLDVKRFISAYLRNKRLKDFGYEDYNKDLILNYISESAFSNEEKYRLLCFTDYLLKSLCYDNDWISREIYNQKLILAKERSYLKWILLRSSKNTTTIICSILLMFILECVILMPAPHSFMEWYFFEKVPYSDNSLLNHIYNVLSLHFSCVENAAKISFSAQGLICLLLGSFVYIVLGINFLFKNLFVNFEVDVAE